MNSIIISVFAILCAVSFSGAVEQWKGTRGNACDEKYDVETRKAAFICAFNTGLNYEDDADLKNIFNQCNKKFAYVEDGNNGMPKCCAEHKSHGGPMSACLLRALNPTKVNPANLRKFRHQIDSDCFKGFTAVDDIATHE